MSFKIKVKKTRKVPILYVGGDITGNNIGKLTSKLEHLLKTSIELVVINLEDVTFIDSHGLGVFVFFFRRLMEQNRKMVILKPSDFVRELFSGSNLDRIFTIVYNESEI